LRDRSSRLRDLQAARVEVCRVYDFRQLAG
jgi:hypothetical protein